MEHTIMFLVFLNGGFVDVDVVLVEFLITCSLFDTKNALNLCKFLKIDSQLLCIVFS